MSMQKAIFLILLLFAVILAAACTEIPPPAPATPIPTSTTPQPTPSFSWFLNHRCDPGGILGEHSGNQEYYFDRSVDHSKLQGGTGPWIRETMQAVVILSMERGSGSVDNPRIGSEIILPAPQRRIG